MADIYPTATICGTMRLFSDMLIVADELTRQGCIVLAPFTRKTGNSASVRQRIERLAQRDGRDYDPDAIHLNATPITADELDRQHRARIERADRVVVVTQFARRVVDETEAAKHGTGFYLGESTRAEIEYACQLDKPIEFARLHRDGDRDTVIWL
ncbi:MAG: hypothetical protein PHQ28_00375 [Mycobacterium sp.]|nr:hypothetical protein [Mycobacterium sp.]